MGYDKSGRMDNPSGKSGSGGDDYGYQTGNTKGIKKAMPDKAENNWLDRHELQHADYSGITGGDSTINE